MISAVIFDWDGTLVDSMDFHYIAYREALKGIRDIKPIDIYLREGLRSVDIITDLTGKTDEEGIRNLVDKKQEIFEGLSKDMRILPEARELILSLIKPGLMIGLVTGTFRKNLNRIMRQGEIGLFDCITTADETDKPKPNPEPYLKCIHALKAKPEETIVIENAPLGIESAKRAGTICIAITSTLPAKHLSKADYVVNTLNEAREIILSHIKKPKNK